MIGKITARNIVWSRIVLIMLATIFCQSGKAQEYHGNTPLMESALQGDLATVKRLVEVEHVDVNALNALGLNALYFAAGASPTRPIEQGVAGSTEVLRYLLKRAANPNANSNRNGMTALMTAATNRRADRVKLLLDHRANPNSATSLGSTALMDAVSRSDLKTIKLLLGHGANPNSATRHGRTALMDAIDGGDVQAIKLLVKAGADIPR